MHRLHSVTRLVSDPSPSHLVELLALIVFIVAVALVLRRIDLSKVFVLAIALEVFSGNWKYFSVPVPLDRLTLLVAVVTLILRGVRCDSERQIVIQPIHLLLLAVTAYAFINGLWAGTILHSYGLYAWLDRLGVEPFIIFTLAPVIFGTKQKRNTLLAGIVILGCYLGIEGLAEGVGVHALELPSYIKNQSLGITAGRTRGPFLASDAMGISLFDCAALAAVAFTLWTRPIARFVCLGVIALSIIDIFFTLTRSVWIGAVIATLVTMLLHPRLRKLVPVAIIGGVGLVVALLEFVPGLSTKTKGRVDTTSSVWDRYNTNHAAIRAWEQHPVFGIGWQTFETKGIDYLREAGTYPLTGEGLEVHNVFLSHLVELGAVGAVLWTAALLIAVGGPAIRKTTPDLWVWRLALSAMCIVFVVVANLGPLSYAFPNMMLWLTAGIVATPFNSMLRVRPSAGADPNRLVVLPGA